MVEVGQFYRLDNAPIYIRITEQASNGWGAIGVEPCFEPEVMWRPGKFLFLASHFKLHWSRISSEFCLKCGKLNPCQNLEISCVECRKKQ